MHTKAFQKIPMAHFLNANNKLLDKLLVQNAKLMWYLYWQKIMQLQLESKLHNEMKNLKNALWCGGFSAITKYMYFAEL